MSHLDYLRQTIANNRIAVACFAIVFANCGAYAFKSFGA